jgi:hypothetical protein
LVQMPFTLTYPLGHRLMHWLTNRNGVSDVWLQLVHVASEPEHSRHGDLHILHDWLVDWNMPGEQRLRHVSV